MLTSNQRGRGHEPVTVLGRMRFAVAVNTSESFTDPSGQLAIVDVKRREVVKRIELAGQPDSVAVSPDRRYVAIVIENERDEDVGDGLIPQAPAGTLQILDLPWLRLRTVPLTGLADFAAGDPEPEYVDINRRNEAVVSLQENNHLVVVDLPKDKPVEVAVTVPQTGELTFACGMDMFKGTIIAQPNG